VTFFYNQKRANGVHLWLQAESCISNVAMTIQHVSNE
jgi:hypothetical protein